MKKTISTRPLLNGRFPLILLLLATMLALTAVVVAAQETLPTQPPSGERGSAIFPERCANCHGPTGAGDGEMAARLEVPPRNFADPAYRQTAVPATMFNMISNGDLNAGMPPFGEANTTNPIAETDRWNLIAAVYSLATPREAMEAGETVYNENCLACHGETGADTEPDLSSYAYWANRSNKDVFDALAVGVVADHDDANLELTDQQRWDVVDYSRGFSYVYYDAIAAAEPIESAMISGEALNGTTNELLSEGIVQLRAFDMDFNQHLAITTTISSDGTYSFEINDADPNWIYMAGVTHGGLNFSSAAGQLTRSDPSINAPITVYDASSDSTAVVIERMHSIVSFNSEDRISVDEVYVIGNLEPAVFIGETGDPDAGVVRIAVPEGAENVFFQRAFSAMQNAIPADEVIPLTDGEWADTLPLHPGDSASNLVLHYEMPYDKNADLTRPLHYNTAEATLIISGSGIDVEGDDISFAGTETMSGMGDFSTYEAADIPAEGTLAIKLSGEPEVIATTPGNNPAAAADNSQIELIVGGVIFVTTIAIAGYIFYSRQTAVGDDGYEEVGSVEDAAAQKLIAQIAALDDAYAAGELEETDYTQQREQLKEELKLIW